jgi:serine/threonine-protein kinase
MGAVYEGVDIHTRRRVAIKVMLASVADQEDAMARFEREAQAVARIDSDHVVGVYGMGDLPSGERYMVMEFLDGESLLARFKAQGPMPPPEAARMVVQLLEGLGKVHAAGIIHRDLKPANVFLARREGRDFVKILDFGICKIKRDPDRSGEIFTGVGDILGTPSYMSPEQLEHGPHLVDARSDLYAVGVLLYRALSGKLPYRAKTLVQLLLQLRAGKHDPIEELVDVDPALAAIVAKAIEWDVAARYQSARAFQLALVDWMVTAKKVESLLSEFLAVRRDAGPPDTEPSRVPVIDEECVTSESSPSKRPRKSTPRPPTKTEVEDEATIKTREQTLKLGPR